MLEKRHCKIILLRVILLVVFVHCNIAIAEGLKPAAHYGDTVIIGTTGEPNILLPMLASDSVAHEIAGLLIRGLVKYDNQNKIVPDLATSWHISEDSKTITFYLRKGIKWQDGSEFDAQDIIAGYQMLKNEKTPSPFKDYYKEIQNIFLINKYTLKIIYKTAYSPSLSTWNNIVAIPHQKLSGEDLTALGRKPISNGPFIIKQWIAGQAIILEANESYFKGRPFLDRVIYKFVPDQATLFLELKAGNIDLLQISPSQYKSTLQDKHINQNYQVIRYQDSGYTFLAFNLLHPLFKDVRVRKAIAYAIDKQEIVDIVLLGLGKVANGPYLPGSWPYYSGIMQYEYNQEKARKLLKDAGWQIMNAEGILMKNKMKLEFTIITPAGNGDRISAATIIQNRLKSIGINIHIRTFEWASFISEIIGKKNFDAVILGRGVAPDPDQYNIWHSSQTDAFNFISFNNLKVDKLLEKGKKNFDLTKRMEIYKEFQSILVDELPNIFLYIPDVVLLAHNRIKNINNSKNNYSLISDIEKWYIPKPLQKYSIK